MQEYSLDCVVGRGPRSLKGGAQGGRDHGGRNPWDTGTLLSISSNYCGTHPKRTQLQCVVRFELRSRVWRPEVISVQPKDHLLLEVVSKYPFFCFGDVGECKNSK